MPDSRNSREKAAAIVRAAGGTIIGRTRLQKVAYLLEIAGLGEGFRFEYRHYGPFSEELADGIRMARAFGLVQEEERSTDWGGFYSVYKASTEHGQRTEGLRAVFAEEAAKISAIELELAATAAFLHKTENCLNPWAETEHRKPEKAADGRLERAKAAYKKLLKFQTPKPMPPIA